MFGLSDFLFVPLGCILGLIWGSFMGAALYRIPLRFNDEILPKWSLWKGRSQCPQCGHVLSPLDLIPLLSWIFLKGHCRYCDQKIGTSYFYVEIFALFTFLISFYVLKLQDISILLSFLATTLLVMSLIDLKHYILPDELQLILFVLGIFLCITQKNTFDFFLTGLWGSLFGAGLLLMVRFFYDWWRGIEGIGLGDVKLVAIAGFYVGIQGIPFVILIGALSTLLWAIPFMILQRQKNLKIMLPFGPGLAFGFLMTFILQNARILPLN
jgi:prepilin signal peptidase PulO-like enzyme (type II secretory pathway)